MSWKQFWLNFLHDYKPIISAFLFGWHIKQPAWIRFFKRTEKEEG